MLRQLTGRCDHDGRTYVHGRASWAIAKHDCEDQRDVPKMCGSSEQKLGWLCKQWRLLFGLKMQKREKTAEEIADDNERTNSMGLFNAAEAYWKSALALAAAKVKAGHADSPVRTLSTMQ